MGPSVLSALAYSFAHHCILMLAYFGMKYTGTLACSLECPIP